MLHFQRKASISRSGALNTHLSMLIQSLLGLTHEYHEQAELSITFGGCTTYLAVRHAHAVAFTPRLQTTSPAEERLFASNPICPVYAHAIAQA